jgi:inorganic triphosphatase YgiF
MSIETEICLQVPMSMARRLTALPLVKSAQASREVLRAVYFDTPQGHLQKARAGLRLRRESGQWVQTFKIERGPSERLELNAPLPVRSAQPPALAIHLIDAGIELPDPRGGKSRIALADIASRLEPLFETRVRRTLWRVSYQGSQLELAFDRGDVVAPDGAMAAVHELEIELLEGQPESLWHLARALSEQLGEGLVLEPRAKAARGYALAGGWRWPNVADVISQKADQHRLDLAFKQALSETVEALSWQIARILETEESEGPHQLRVALRRFRSVMKLVRPLLAAPEWRDLEQASKALASRVGVLRDRDVLAEDVLAPLVRLVPQDEDIQRLSTLLGQERQRAREALRSHLRSVEVQRFVLDLALAAGRSLPGLSAIHAADFAKEQLKRLARRARRREAALDAATEQANAEARHELRLAYKSLRYAAGWLGQIGAGAQAEAARRRASKRQQQLGEQQDASMALGLVSQLLSEEPLSRQARLKGMLEGWLLAKGLV